jgi:hypothetical protein
MLYTQRSSSSAAAADLGLTFSVSDGMSAWAALIY